jgi:hypothetical protein
MRSFVLIIGCALATWSTPASAQTSRPERPYRGLFGSGVDDAGDLLTLGLSAGLGYDDNAFEQLGFAGPDVEGVETGLFTQLTGSLNYSRKRSRGDVGATLASDVRYLPDLPNELISAHSASIGTSLQIARRTTVVATQNVGFQPYLTFNLFPVLVEPPVGQSQPADIEQGTGLTDYWTYSTNVGVERQLSRRNALSGSYTFFKQDPTKGNDDLSTQSVRGGLSIGVARGLAVRMGYGFHQVRFGGLDPRDATSHSIDAGVTYDKALSFSRRTTFSFSTGSAAYTDLGQTTFQVIGDARLNHEIGRTWNAVLAYARNVSFVAAFEQPFLSDSLTAGLSGMLHRRVQASLSANGSIGAVGFAEGDTGYATYTGNAGMSIGLTRQLALSASYTYYYYDFGSDVALPLGLVRQQDRQVAQVSLSMSFPLFYRPRRV